MLPVRPSRLAIGVMVFVWDVVMELVLFSVADRAVLKVGAWKVSLRRIRWWTMWYRCRKSSVLCEGLGNSDGFEVDLGVSVPRDSVFVVTHFSKCLCDTL